MKIGLVTGEYPPMEGGVGAYTREIARALAAEGHSVRVFTRTAAQGADEPDIAIDAVIDESWGWQTNRQIKAWVQQHSLDVVNIQFQTAAYDMHAAIHWLPKKLKPATTVVTFHDLRVPYLFPKAGPARTLVVKKLAQDASGAISTNRADEQTLRADWQIPAVTWIPIGSNIEPSPPRNYERAAWRDELRVSKNDLLIGYFGFLNESKGGLVLIDALAELVAQDIPAHLVMIGGRAGASDLTNYAYGQQVDDAVAKHHLTGRVHWTGFVDDDAVSGHFLASDIAALPYLDGVSLRRGTLMAALVHGRAIVTTEPEIETPELDGVLDTVPAGDAHALSEAIKRLWQEKSRREALEKAALEAAQHFRWDDIARRTAGFFETLRG